MCLILGVKSPQETGLPFQNLGQRSTFSLPYTPNLCDQPGGEKFSVMEAGDFQQSLLSPASGGW